MNDFVQKILVTGDSAAAVKALTDLKKTADETNEALHRGAQKSSAGLDMTMRSALGLGAAFGGGAAAGKMAAEALIRVAEAAVGTVDAYGHLERTLQRVQHETGATNAEMGVIKDTLYDISARTGESFDKLATGFRRFAAETNLSGDDAIKVFKDIALNADLAGVSTQHMAIIGAAAINQLGVKSSEVTTVLGGMEQRLKGTAGEFASVFPEIALCGLQVFMQI